MTDNTPYITDYCHSAAARFTSLAAGASDIEAAANVVSSALMAGNKVLLCGNGGSAADAQHIAAELIGRFEKERRALAAMALTTDTSILTAVANDYDFDRIFARQIDALGTAGDVLIAISTSGNSANVLAAAKAAANRDMATLALTGEGGGALVGACDHAVRVPSDKTSHIQEMHIAVGHMICAMVESALA